MAAPARALAPLLRGDAVTIVRDGPEGCAVTVAGETTLLPGFRQKAVDTNGAGDTHTGALVADVAAGSRGSTPAGAPTRRPPSRSTRRGPATGTDGVAEVEAFLAAESARRERRQTISDWPGSGRGAPAACWGPSARAAASAWRSASRVAASSAASSSLRARRASTWCSSSRMRRTPSMPMPARVRSAISRSSSRSRWE